MSLQRYRADEAHEPFPNGAVPWYARWMGGPSLALIRSCPTMFGPRTVYVTGEPDTFFSIPAACKVQGKTVRGFLFMEDGSMWFHAYLGE